MRSNSSQFWCRTLSEWEVWNSYVFYTCEYHEYGQKISRIKIKHRTSIGKLKGLIDILKKKRVDCAAGATICIKVLELDWKRRRPFNAKCQCGKGIFKWRSTWNKNCHMNHARSKLSVCEEKLVTTDEVIQVQLSFSSIITAQIIQSGQGFQKNCNSNYT